MIALFSTVFVKKKFASPKLLCIFSFYALVIFSEMPLPVGFGRFPERQVDHPCSADSGLFRGGDLMLTSHGL